MEGLLTIFCKFICDLMPLDVIMYLGPDIDVAKGTRKTSYLSFTLIIRAVYSTKELLVATKKDSSPASYQNNVIC